MIAFLAGMALVGLLILAIILDAVRVVTPVFGCIFLIAVVGFAIYLGIIGLLLSPFLLAGGMITLCLWVLSVMAAGGDNNGKQK